MEWMLTAIHGNNLYFQYYIWVLVGVIIFVSHYSQWFTNLPGSNPVFVLATLVLFSYTKILHTWSL